ncbi:MAG TPA: hypothetical protein VFQ61_17945, partial [Polyangiaceae bacterium]|nr:hypothetical protein [Polyangiaceae bacterium]
MPSPNSSRFRRSLLVLFLTWGLLLIGGVAHAAGRVEWKSKELKERSGGSWRVELAIFMPRAPDVAHVPMKFEFQPTAYYERSMVDGDKLIERVVPLENRQALIESVDVGFLDSGSGKIESRTRFTFNVTRAHGYEAGEYKVTIRDSRNGQVVGQAVSLKFTGENEVIDRRAMVFTGNDKKKKKKDAEEGGDKSDKGEDSAKAKSDSSEGSNDEAKEKTESKSDSDATDSSAASSSEETSGKADDESQDQEIKEKPGGCGCRVIPAQSSSSGLWL